jgi:hypothetical protein
MFWAGDYYEQTLSDALDDRERRQLLATLGADNGGIDLDAAVVDRCRTLMPVREWSPGFPMLFYVLTGALGDPAKEYFAIREFLARLWRMHVEPEAQPAFAEGIPRTIRFGPVRPRFLESVEAGAVEKLVTFISEAWWHGLWERALRGSASAIATLREEVRTRVGSVLYVGAEDFRRAHTGLRARLRRTQCDDAELAELVWGADKLMQEAGGLSSTASPPSARAAARADQEDYAKLRAILVASRDIIAIANVDTRQLRDAGCASLVRLASEPDETFAERAKEVLSSSAVTLLLQEKSTQVPRTLNEANALWGRVRDCLRASVP